jgi:uncharacterized protein (DUF4415 family)
MSENGSTGRSRTDWERVRAMTDDEIDFSDIPELTDEFFARATIREPSGGRQLVSVTVPVDPVVLSWYKAQGNDWERHVQAALREYLLAHVNDE